ncbi:VOC family protein [Mesorhizobium sp. NBSH29]|uniref:VOC family protein n=1 Tax=Mesorhizobium sp. NBSH29 TaxID=2654249 RepID=UPI00189692D9|nr:VOC family protein [Mesorhizobium sp. NBSH29]QPC86575.1 VOC family protein [Mesorhizobium sp. NBSH29]
MQKITPMLWFDSNAEEAVDFYVSVFKSATKGAIMRNGENGPGPAGSALTVAFDLEGMSFTALNGGPHFQLSEAVSFVVKCADQAEIDYFWEALSQGGKTQPCGWIKDRFGLSWQIMPDYLLTTLAGEDKEKSGRVFEAVMQMEKLDIATLKAAANAGSTSAEGGF